jgi:hypothetical protein
MYASRREASISAVAQIIGSFRGRQVAMAILRQVENESGDFSSAIDDLSMTSRDGLGMLH